MVNKKIRAEDLCNGNIFPKAIKKWDGHMTPLGLAMAEGGRNQLVSLALPCMDLIPLYFVSDSQINRTEWKRASLRRSHRVR